MYEIDEDGWHRWSAMMADEDMTDNVSIVSYDEETGALVLAFSRDALGEVYEGVQFLYPGVPGDVYRALRDAPDRYAYFSEHIYGVYTFGEPRRQPPEQAPAQEAGGGNVDPNGPVDGGAVPVVVTGSGPEDDV